MVTLEYYLIKFIGKIKRDKHEETLNNWFMKKASIYQSVEAMFV